MDEYKDIQVASWMAARALGAASPEEEEKLEAWLAEGAGNRALHERLAGKERSLEERGERSMERVKARVMAGIRRRRVAGVVSRVAAIVMLPLLAGGAWWYLADGRGERAPVPLLEIVPGGGPVTLEMADGTRARLDAGRVFEMAGATARADSGCLSYTRDEVDADAGYNVLTTARGGEYGLVLSDGTRVWLNAGSRLRYPVTFTGASREVWLEGEAYFEVSRSGAPFRTRVGSAVVEVLGTSFNVTGYADDPVVVATLSSGKVRVSVDGRPDERVELLPGGQAQVDAASGTITTREVDAGVYASWRESLFVFDDESLEAIARKLARWYDVEIEIASPSARGAVFYGVLPKYATIAVFLERVKQVYDMEYVIEGRKIVLI